MAPNHQCQAPLSALRARGAGTRSHLIELSHLERTRCGYRLIPAERRSPASSAAAVEAALPLRPETNPFGSPTALKRRNGGPCRSKIREFPTNFGVRHEGLEPPTHCASWTPGVFVGVHWDGSAMRRQPCRTDYERLHGQTSSRCPLQLTRKIVKCLTFLQFSLQWATPKSLGRREPHGPTTV